MFVRGVRGGSFSGCEFVRDLVMSSSGYRLWGIDFIPDF